MARSKHPARQLPWRSVESSNVSSVAYDERGAYVCFKNGAVYLYEGVSRQRAVALRSSKSVGAYLNSKIKPSFPAVRIA